MLFSVLLFFHSLAVRVLVVTALLMSQCFLPFRACEVYGPVAFCGLSLTPDRSRCRGYGFVDFENVADAVRS